LHQFNCDSLGIVVIVSVTRGDLREEFSMANDTFALSPISASSTQPSEEDYDAISEAFMETARGRWFLGEYAKRNRNADTRMVLDAVERIEQSLAAQKIPEPEPVPDTRLFDALTVIKAAVDEARDAAAGAVDDLALSQRLAPIRKGTRVIREISWRWREIGADSRICDLIDSQVSAIEASCAQISLADPHPGLQAAFALIDRAVAAFDENKEAEPEAAADVMPSDEMPSAETEAAAPAKAMSMAGEAEATAPVGDAEQPLAVEALSAETSSAETISAEALSVEASYAEAEQPDAAAEGVPVEASTSESSTLESSTSESSTSMAKAIEIAIAATTSETADEAVAEITPELADAQDEALLDMVAAEMGAPDLSDEGEYYSAALAEAEAAEAEAAETQAVAPSAAETEIEAAATPLPDVYPSLQPALERAPEPSPAAAPPPSLASAEEPSLGSTVIASGLVSKPKPSSDPLAALRRLSQVEKIALFS
jgi:hypothetical protein